MEEIKFSWDARKAKQNLKKHKVSFEEAATVFYDDNAVEFFDPDHSKDEDRFLMLGLSWRLRALVVCYCLRKKGLELGLFPRGKQPRKSEKPIWEQEYEERV